MRICVIHLNQIGDLVFSLPLLKALRDRYPDAEIHSVMKPYLKDLLAGSPLVNETIARQGGVRETLRLARTLRRNRYDLLISLARSEEAFILTSLSRAGTKAGFVRFPFDMSLDVKELVLGHNSWYNNARLLDRLGIPRTADTYVGLLPVEPAECNIIIPEPYVVISAGASPRRLTKAWDEEKFAQLIVSLYERSSLRPVLVGAGDTRESNALITLMVKNDPKGKDIDVLDLTGKLNLRSLTALLMRAGLFVGIDSGVMHLASASDIPVVALFGPTDPYYVGPQNERSIVVRSDMECIPCYLDKSCRHIECMRKLGTEQVMDACIRVMDRV
ncbi:MAG TPA: glycosyltransferase family 9 protein [Deltaproteobacteria bacterium]|jgi:ADP-heptose:LPS heptosyltransferase|nr:glycosyltransferase family 9 protein [Deltaproteobacteria bacterium]HQH99983.1 glycosyltransferase family 9 protein [Deltaproteobacteria bacterium]